MAEQRKKIKDLGCALYLFCVSPAGNINNDNYNNDNNGVRPFWWRARQSRHRPKSMHHIKRTHNLSRKEINKEWGSDA